jgi:hypothetical protein
MAHTSLEDKAIEALDQALQQSDPISRMMLIEQALRLHRQSMEARDAEPAQARATAELAEPRRR